MVRDRLKELQKIQEEDGVTDDKLDGHVNLSMEVTAEQASMDRFFSQIEEVQEGVHKIEAAIDQVRKKHSEILTSSHTEPDVKKELDDLTAEIKRVGARINLKLKELAPKDTDENEKNHASARIRRTQHSAATHSFVEAMKQYHQVQEEYRDRCKDKIHRQLQITGKNPTEEELDEMLQQENLEIFTQGIMMETQQAKMQLADIEERHQEIMKLETSIRELHQLFMDTAVMIHSQGEMINNIAAHVSSAQDYVEEAKVQTGKALELQTSARKKKIICGVIVLVVLVILIVLIIVSV